MPNANLKLETISMGSGLEDIRTPTPEEEGPKRALVVAAHPDDSEFGVAGTAARWSQEGWEFYYLICTDGSKGSEDPEMTPEKLVPLRREEQRAAARVLGVKEVFFLDYVDGELRYTPELMRESSATSANSSRTRSSRTTRTRSCGTCSSTTPITAARAKWRSTPSTRSRATGRAFRSCWPKGLEPYSVKEIYLWTASDTTFEVDITDTIETKFEALRQHASQMGDMEEAAPRLRQFWSGPDGRYLERFRQIVLPF